jgi:large subunit ribosomal protein L24
MSRLKTHVNKGDYVRVTSGEHKGAEGKVLQVFPAKGRALVEKVRLIKKHERKSQDRPQGGIVEREGTIHISNLKLVEQGEKKSGGRKKKSAKSAE